MSDNEELQSKLNALLGKLPGNYSAEIIEDNEPLINAAPQSEPGQALSDELLAEIARAAEAVARDVFGGDVRVEVDPPIEISPLDNSAESREAMLAMIKRLMRPQCYHYILNDRGEPVHTEDVNEVMAFQRDKKDILATQSFDCFGLEMKLTTRFMVHNPMTSNVPPVPRWVAELLRVETGECGYRKFAQSKDEAWSLHHEACREVLRVIAKHAEGEGSNE